MDPRASPVNPIPRSARKVRLVREQQPGEITRSLMGHSLRSASADREEIIVIEQGARQAFAGAGLGLGGSLLAEPLPLRLQEREADLALGGGRLAGENPLVQGRDKRLGRSRG